MRDNQPDIRLAGSDDLADLLPLVRAYHEFENVVQTDEERAAAIFPLLVSPTLGRIWLINVGHQPVGYIALCFGYSIEFKGKDAFIDEFFVKEPWRGKGIGSFVLSAICKEAARLEVKALHLEVQRENHSARKLYASNGFDSREQFHMMSRVL